MTEADKLDAMNRTCELLLGKDIKPHTHYDFNYSEGSQPWECSRCHLMVSHLSKCKPEVRNFCSDDSPRSLITELINCIGGVKLKKLNGYYEGWEPSMILETTAYHIVQCILKVTDKWNTNWD